MWYNGCMMTPYFGCEEPVEPLGVTIGLVKLKPYREYDQPRSPVDDGKRIPNWDELTQNAQKAVSH